MITSFSLSTDKTGFLGLPPAKKWVLYGETGSGLGRPQIVHSTCLAARGILCSPPYLQAQRSQRTPCAHWLLCILGHCSDHRLPPRCMTFAVLQPPC